MRLPGDTTGFCKIIAERGSGPLLGAHVLGLRAAAVIQPLIQAMPFGQHARELATGQYWIHRPRPSSSRTPCSASSWESLGYGGAGRMRTS